MVKTYLVPVSDELIKAMEKGEAPSFLHCATCLDGLTNGEVIRKLFPKVEYIGENTHAIYLSYGGDECEIIALELEWWNRKWGE